MSETSPHCTEPPAKQSLHSPQACQEHLHCAEPTENQSLHSLHRCGISPHCTEPLQGSHREHIHNSTLPTCQSVISKGVCAARLREVPDLHCGVTTGCCQRGTTGTKTFASLQSAEINTLTAKVYQSP